MARHRDYAGSGAAALGPERTYGLSVQDLISASSSTDIALALVSQLIALSKAVTRAGAVLIAVK